MVARFLNQKLQGLPFVPPSRKSAFGSLLNAITLEDKEDFQPTNINFGLFPAAEGIRDKAKKREFILDRAKTGLAEFIAPSWNLFSKI